MEIKGIKQEYIEIMDDEIDETKLCNKKMNLKLQIQLLNTFCDLSGIEFSCLKEIVNCFIDLKILSVHQLLASIFINNVTLPDMKTRVQNMLRTTEDLSFYLTNTKIHPSHPSYSALDSYRSHLLSVSKF